MTIEELRKLMPGTKVVWVQDGSSPSIGIIHTAGVRKKDPRWIEWEDGQRTEDYDEWALVHVEVFAK